MFIATACLTRAGIRDLEEMVEKRAADKHKIRDSANGDDEITPSHIHRYGTARFARSSDRAGAEGRVTFIIDEDASYNERADRPTEGHQTERRVQRPWDAEGMTARNKAPPK